MTSFKTFVKFQRPLRVTLIVRVMRKIAPPNHAQLWKAYGTIFRALEGGGLIVRVPGFPGSFEIDLHYDILRRILVNGDYEPEVVAMVRQRVDPNRDAIDYRRQHRAIYDVNFQSAFAFRQAYVECRSFSQHLAGDSVFRPVRRPSIYASYSS